MSPSPCGMPEMIALDTNILARFYVDNPSDPEAVRQCLIARRLLTNPPQAFVPLTVILELEWVSPHFMVLRQRTLCGSSDTCWVAQRQRRGLVAHSRRIGLAHRRAGLRRCAAPSVQQPLLRIRRRR